MPKISINNVELHYEKHGTGAQSIIFVHGFLLSSIMWQDFYMARLPEHYHAYAIDMRGHGHSHAIKQSADRPIYLLDSPETMAPEEAFAKHVNPPSLRRHDASLPQ